MEQGYLKLLVPLCCPHNHQFTKHWEIDIHLITCLIHNTLGNLVYDYQALANTASKRIYDPQDCRGASL